MSNLLFVVRRVQAGFLCCLLVLLCVSSAVGDPKPLSKEEQEKVDAAIDKGVAFLKKAQTKKGDWPRRYQGTYPVGQCALPAYALLESGVAADDPVIQKAATFLREKAIKTCYTYELSLAILFFDRLGDPKDKALIQSMALRLVAGQSRTGGWMYRSLPVSEKQEKLLLKSLKELNKRIEIGKSSAEALRDLDIPPPFRCYTVFQDSRTFDWQEVGDYDPLNGGIPLIGITDNSNTQFALMALWVAQRQGIPMGPTFRLSVERFERSQVPDGRWLYRGGYNGASPSSLLLATRSMTCAGLLALAVGRGSKLPTPGIPPPGREDLRTLRGFTALYQQIGFAKGSFGKRVPQENVYFLWSVERVAMLYNLQMIGDKDWYRWGAEILFTNQQKTGSWPGTPVQREASRVPTDYGPMLNTAFALLFLKRSHPMKDLTPKLPFTEKELNEGIACLRRGEKLPERPAAIVSPNKKDEP